MTLDYATLDLLRQRHPAWRLLRSDHAPLVAGFLHRVFIVPNKRVIDEAALSEALEDELFTLRQRLGEDSFPKSALDYLNDWAGTDKGWLRKFYGQESDEPQFDLTPAAEKAIAWLNSLTERSFVGTESRLLTLFDLLRQICEGSEADPEKRVAELRKRRDEIDAEIARVEAGEVSLLNDTSLKDRFQQFVQTSRELLSDFREVEQNFRFLDRRVRERIALWEGAKGALLDEVMGERDAIADSDQGRSFRAFWDFLMSSRRQDELSDLLARILDLSPIQELKPDPRIRRIHYDWLEAGEHAQRTVARLSQQLRRFLDDQARLENRRIMEILRGIEAKALAIRGTPPKGEFFEVDESYAGIELPLERPLHTITRKTRLASIALEAGEEDLDAAVLFSQIVVDRALLGRHIRQALQERPQITLGELVERRPLRNGLAELVAYLHLGSDGFTTVVDEEQSETVSWRGTGRDGLEIEKRAVLPRVVFVR